LGPLFLEPLVIVVNKTMRPCEEARQRPHLNCGLGLPAATSIVGPTVQHLRVTTVRQAGSMNHLHCTDPASHIPHHATTHQPRIQGTDLYNAPERSNKSDMRKVDVWALGIVLFELLSGQRLFTWRTEQQKYMQLVKLYSDTWAPPQLPAHVAGWQEVIDAMLTVDPEQRPLPSDVLKLGIFGCGPTACTVAMCHPEGPVNRLVSLSQCPCWPPVHPLSW
jgi:serine/threonine protein kinase